MFARVSTYQGAANLDDDDVEEITRRTEHEVLPTVRDMTGFRGVLTLLDRTSGKGMSVTLWESEDAMRASEEAANQTRAQAAGIARQEVQGVERYEVTFSELP